MSRNTLLIDCTTLKERTTIHSNVDNKLITPDLKIVQDMHILPILGSALFFKLQDLIDANPTGLPASNYKDLIDLYVVDCFVNYAMAELCTTLNFQFWNKGVGSSNDASAQPPSMSDLFNIVNKYKNRAEFYKKRLIMYLKKNAATMYPEYATPGWGVDTVIPDRTGYTSPIYLGDDKIKFPANVPEVFNSNDPSYY